MIRAAELRTLEGVEGSLPPFRAADPGPEEIEPYNQAKEHLVQQFTSSLCVEPAGENRRQCLPVRSPKRIWAALLQRLPRSI